jgi:DNA repair protein RadA
LVEERLANMVDNRGGKSGLEIPNHKDWIVTMWHFGAHASILYKGNMFHVSWKIAEPVLVAFYSKMWKDNRYRIRAERQEYPNKPLDVAMVEKMNASRGEKESEISLDTSDHKESQESLSLTNRQEEPDTNNSFFRSAADDLQRTEHKRLSTGSKHLDELLEGGLESGIITEFYGAPKTGKTHLCHLLCIALPQPFRVMYVDTEGTFQKQKIESIAKARNLEWKNTLTRIQLAQPKNINEQELTIREACSVLKSNPTFKIKLLIINSLIFHYRSEYIGRAKLLERQHRLNQQMHLLSDLATTNDVAVVITNHLYSDPHASSLADKSKPLGGHIVSYMTKYIIKLEYLDRVYHRAILEKSPCRGYVSRYLRIAECGFKDEGPRFIRK